MAPSGCPKKETAVLPNVMVHHHFLCSWGIAYSRTHPNGMQIAHALGGSAISRPLVAFALPKFADFA